MKRTLLLAALLALPALADRTSTTLLSAVTVTGPSPQIYAAASPVPDGSERWSFQKAGSGMARLEVSNDGGSTWASVHAFLAPNDVFGFPECGACRFRVFVTRANTADTVSVYVVVSGAVVAETTP